MGTMCVRIREGYANSKYHFDFRVFLQEVLLGKNAIV